MDPPSPAKKDTLARMEESRGEDPDGTYKSDASDASFHGEKLTPTSNSFTNFSYDSEDKILDRVEDSSDSNIAITEDEEDIDDDSEDNSEDIFVDELVPSISKSKSNHKDPEVALQSIHSLRHMSGDSYSFEQDALKHSAFPSVGFLVCLAVMIVIALTGLVGGLTYYVWEKTSLDPLRPPNSLGNGPYNDEGLPTLNFGEDASDSNLLLPSDTDLWNLFATVVGTAALADTTKPASRAAYWMLYEDSTKATLPRSEEAWIQRYSLVYAYYSTTSNGTTAWLSCNPSSLVASDVDVDDESTCKFASPTELPNGRVVYDFVPSHRWLSATDECQWGGVGCGKTVTGKISIRREKGGPATTEQDLRSTVTSIVLAGQNLKGSIVTELTQLPHLETLDLSHNGLVGTVGEEFRFLKKLRLQYNRISGSIPPSLFNETSLLNELNLGSNSMTGSIPSAIGLSSELKTLSVFDNAFTGTIPVLGNMPLETFHGQNNLFRGILPFDYDYGGTWPNTLREWWLYNNTISGSIAANIGFLSNLEDLRIHGNLMTGSIPESVGELTRLFRFEAHSNNLVGNIPDTMGDLSSLRDVRVQFNALTGAIPPSLCFLESIEALEADCSFRKSFQVEAEDEAFRVKTKEEVGLFGAPFKAETGDEAFQFTIEERTGLFGLSFEVQEGDETGNSNPNSDSTETGIQCYCCTKCCDAEAGDCRSFSTLEV